VFYTYKEAKKHAAKNGMSEGNITEVPIGGGGRVKLTNLKPPKGCGEFG